MVINDVLAGLVAIPRAIISIPERISKYHQEQERARKLEEERIATLPDYSDGVSREQFEAIISAAKREIPRIRDARIDGLVVILTVKSQSGISLWEATIDFNDFGHLTGWWKATSENQDSDIPESFAREVVIRLREHKEALEKVQLA